jgi:hypothetical protein
MAAMFKKLLAVCAATLLTVATYAAAVELREDHPDTYVVQKGDTLWDIAARFLNEPWLWPEIWQANPQVENPHLIYPGDVLSLAYLGDGRPSLAVKRSPEVRRTRDDAIDAIPLSEIEPFLRSTHVLSEDEYKGLPYVVGLEEGRLRAAEGQVAYVRGAEFSPGQRWAVVRPTVRFAIDADPEDPEDVHTFRDDWDATNGVRPQKVGVQWARHIGDGDGYQVLGYEVVEMAQGVVTVEGDPGTLLITPGGRDVAVGDLLLPYDPHPYDLTFYPHARDGVPPYFRVLAMTDRLEYGGPRDVVALSAGARDGVENGQVYSIWRPGELVRDEIAHKPRFAANLKKNKVRLPDEFVGHVMVFRTFEKVSYGLVMDGIRPTKIEDELKPPVRY